jgi:hypothetical protein
MIGTSAERANQIYEAWAWFGVVGRINVTLSSDGRNDTQHVDKALVKEKATELVGME